MEFLKNWVMYVTGAAILSAVCIKVVPEGRVKKTVQLVCGLVTLLSLAYPVTDGRLNELESFEFVQIETEQLQKMAEETEKTVTRMVIEEQFETYILDKGEILGVEVTEADVSVRWNEDGYWYPVRAEIVISEGHENIYRLSAVISEELGIDIDNIYWS